MRVGLSLAWRLLLWGLAFGTLAACTDEMPAMRLFNERTNRFDKRIHLDWTIIGGVDQRSDRLLLVDDGHARRNKGGNLFTRAPMTAEELAELDALRNRWGRIVIEWHSAAEVRDEGAHRLRFDGRGQDGGGDEVRAFAERVLDRLEPGALARAATDVVEATVVRRQRDGRAEILVERALVGRLDNGDIVRVTLPEAREGVGEVPTVFALWSPTRVGDDWTSERCAYLKSRYEEVASWVASR